MKVKIGDTYDDLIPQIIRPKSFILNCGEKGGGKTNLAQRTLYMMSKEDWLTITNTRYKVYRLDNGEAKAEKVENDNSIPMKMHSSIADIFTEICKHKERKGLRAPAMVETDEFASYFYKWEYWKPLTTAFLKLVPLMRKIDVCWMGTTAGEELIPRELRTKVGGYCDWRLKKDVHLTRRLTSRRFSKHPHVKAVLEQVKEDLDGRNPTEDELLKRVVFIDDLANDEGDLPVFVSGAFPYKPMRENEKPVMGRSSYSEYSAATLTLGNRKNGKELDLHKVIQIMSDEIEEDIPGKILGYIEGDGKEKDDGTVELTDHEFIAEFVRRTKGKTRWGKKEKPFNLVNIMLDISPKRAYEVIQKVKKK